MNRFSVGWFVGIILLNLLGTALLGLMAFAAAWRAPIGGPSHAGVGPDGMQLLLWIWATGPMVASLLALLRWTARNYNLMGVPVRTIGGFVGCRRL